MGGDPSPKTGPRSVEGGRKAGASPPLPNKKLAPLLPVQEGLQRANKAAIHKTKTTVNKQTPGEQIHRCRRWGMHSCAPKEHIPEYIEEV